MKNYNASCGDSCNYFEKILYATFFFLLTEKLFNSNFQYQDDLFIKSLINTKCKGLEGLDTLEAPLWSLAFGLAQTGGYSLLILMNSLKVAYQNFCLCRNGLEFFDKKYKWLHENPVDFFHPRSPQPKISINRREKLPSQPEKGEFGHFHKGENIHKPNLH